MKPSESTPGGSERLEEIVSYLDGEMSAEESARVERRLASDEEFRQELQSIDRAWSVLDQLPLATVEDRFSKTTMEMVVQTARNEVEQKTLALPVLNRKQGFKEVMFVAMAVLLGFLVFRIAWQSPNRDLLADLPVIQNIEVYTQFQEVDFLRQLNPKGRENFWPSKSSEAEGEVQQLAMVSSSEDREVWLQTLTEDERVGLRAKYNRYRSLASEKQEQLRRLHEEIDSDDEVEQLRRTMVHYQLWLNGLPASQQYELRGLSTEQRVKRVTRMLRQLAADKSLDLTSEELKSLFKAVVLQIEEKKAEILSQMSERDKESFMRLPGHEKRKHLMVWLMRDSRRRGGQIPDFLLDSIPEEKLQTLRKLPSEEKRRRFFLWMREAYAQEGGNRKRPARRNSGEIPEQELEKYFTEELDAATMERLLALSREKMQQQLVRRYRSGMPQEDWEELFDGGHGPPPRRGPVGPGEGREGREGRRGGPRPRNGPRGRVGPPGDRPQGRPSVGREGRGYDRRAPAEGV